MPKPLPFPLEVFEIEQVKRLTASQFGIFARLAFSYWQTGIPLPDKPYTIARLANCDITTINRQRDPVFECLSLVMPAIENRYQKTIETKAKQRKVAENIRNIKMLKLRIKRQAKESLLSDENAVCDVGITAILSTYRDYKDELGRYDQSARKHAVESPKKPEKTLTDE